jgi:uncharacterized protein (DUF1800 family)
MLRALLLSPEFRAEANYYTTVKNPPEFVVGTLKLLGLDQGLRDKLRPPLLRGLAQAVSQMGMPLFAPPNVGGWPGGRGWINPGTYFARANFVEHLLALAAGQSLPDLAALAGGQGRATPDAIVAALLELALPAVPSAPLQGPLVNYLGGDPGTLKLTGLWRLVLSSPSYQLN